MADLCPVFEFRTDKEPVNGQKYPVFKWSGKSCDCHLNTGYPKCPVFR